jgi:hypothetical protein
MDQERFQSLPNVNAVPRFVDDRDFVTTLREETCGTPFEAIMLPDYVVDELLKRERSKDSDVERIELELPKYPRPNSKPAYESTSEDDAVIIIDMCPDESEMSETLGESSESEPIAD